MAVEGMPLFLIELGIGQRLRTGPVGVWNAIHPYLGGNHGFSNNLVIYSYLRENPLYFCNYDGYRDFAVKCTVEVENEYIGQTMAFLKGCRCSKYLQQIEYPKYNFSLASLFLRIQYFFEVLFLNIYLLRKHHCKLIRLNRRHNRRTTGIVFKCTLSSVLYEVISDVRNQLQEWVFRRLLYPSLLRFTTTSSSLGVFIICSIHSQHNCRGA